jgi:hypothetical protein
MSIVGTTVFCDDIRSELGGKLTLVGCYGTQLIATHFPLILPKMGFFLRTVFPFDERPESMVLNIYLPQDNDRPSKTWKPTAPAVTREEYARMPRPFDAPPAEELVLVRTNHTVLTQVHITKEGFIRVRGNADGKVIMLGSLRVSREDNTRSPAP